MTPPSNRREHPRVELVATVEVAAAEGELIVLTATNLSVGGLFLETDPGEFPVLRRGILLGLTISLADSASVDEDASLPASAAPPPPQVVRCRGKIVRIQNKAADAPGGFGVVIVDLPASELHALHALLARANHAHDAPPAPPPPPPRATKRP